MRLSPRTPQDFQGQKLSEYLYYYIIILFGAAGWLYGWREGSFLPAFYAWAAGLVLSLIVSLTDGSWCGWIWVCGCICGPIDRSRGDCVCRGATPHMSKPPGQLTCA